jgi:hypothetical protein
MSETPNLNTGKSWSDADDLDLKAALEHCPTIQEIADFLCRTEQEVRDRMRELKLS